jgi:translocation and assembly module TamA
MLSPSIRRHAFALPMLLAAVCADAAVLREVRIEGVSGEERENVEASLSLLRLSEKQKSALSEGRLSYLIRRANDEARDALQPYGYYDAKVDGEVERAARGVVVTLRIERGDPVLVTAHDIAMEGVAADDEQVQSVLAAFRPRPQQRLDQRLYEASKLAVQRRLLERGYFDAELLEHRIELRQRMREALLRLKWNSGQRYRFGTVRVEGSQIRRELIEKTIPFERGKRYHQRELLALHQRLTDLDYFGYIDVRPDPEQAEGDQVPIQVAVTPGKRSVYTAGVSYGTDSGGGVQLGLERRWVNDRGHKLGAQLDYAQRRKSLSLLYRIPAFEWAEGWYAFGANRRDEDSEFVSSRITELVAQRTGRIHGWDFGLALHVRNEEFEIGSETRSVQSGERRLVYPALSAERKRGDDELYPRRGFSLRGELKLGHGAIGSQTDFAQFQADAKLIRPLGEDNRLLMRAQFGRTFTDEFDELPPSLRFFAGGDRSIRGYGYQEVGPRIDDQVIGGKHLLTASVEFEHMFGESWGAAAFVDAGDAYDSPDTFRARTGVGAGVRWRSPVGLVRFDLAHGLDDADNAIQIHINIGPDL